jgi:rhodanese-related sulfurtransferase
MDEPVVVEEICARDVHALKAAPLLLDVREHEELAVARIPGALHIPMGEIAVRLSEIPDHRDVVVFCHHGKRSYSVASWLKRAGFTRVRSLRGGIDAWSCEVDPSIPRY